jgi:hypothetical protein
MSTRANLILCALLLTGAAAFLWAQPAGHDGDGRPPKGAAAGDGDAKPPPAAITDQQETELIASLTEKRPEEAARLRRLKDENPRAYRGQLVIAWRAYQVWKDLPPEIQKLYETQQRSRLEAWRQAQNFMNTKDSAQKERIHDRLMETLGSEFDAELGIRQYRLGQLEDQLKRLRAELKDRADHRAQGIEQNLQDLLTNKFRPKPDGDIHTGPDGRSLDGRPFAPAAGSRPFAAHPATHPAAAAPTSKPAE